MGRQQANPNFLPKENLRNVKNIMSLLFSGHGVNLVVFVLHFAPKTLLAMITWGRR